MIKMILAIIVWALVSLSLIYLMLSMYLRAQLGISLKEFSESISLLTELQTTGKHKALEFMVSKMISSKFDNKQKLNQLRKEIQQNIDIIDRIPSYILSDEDESVRDTLISASNKIGVYVYSL